ncbi:MAG: MFS transporter [Lachnospiraceae bacterium]
MRAGKKYYVVMGVISGLIVVVGLWFGGTLITNYTMIIADDMGISRSVFSVFMMIRGLVAFVLNIKMLQLIRRFGLKMLVLAGLGSAIVMLFFLSFCRSILPLYATGIIGAISAAFTGVVPVSIIVQNWFRKSQGMLLALIMSSSGIVGVIFNPIVSLGVDHFGWRIVFRMAAALIFGIFFLSAFLLKVSPEDVNMLPYGGKEVVSVKQVAGDTQIHIMGKSIQDKNMRTLLAVSILYSLGGMCIFVNSPAILADIGFSAVFATGLAAALNSLANCIGKFGMGRLSDKVGSKMMLLLWYGITLTCPRFLYQSQC